MKQQPIKSEKLMELDIVRAVCILAVALIHGISFAVVELPEGGAIWSVYLLVNKLAHFTVPVFLFVSGLVLTYRYAGSWSARSIVPFYLKRIRQVLIPYLIWSLFYYITPQFYTSPYFFQVNLRDFFDKLIWADIGYHLYFLIIVMQFYLLFPLLLTAAVKLRLKGTSLVAAGAAIQVIYYVIEFYVHPFGHRASICFNYMTLLSFGAAVGMNYSAFRDWAGNRLRFLSVFTVAFGCWFAGMFLLEEWFQIRLHNTLFEIAMVGYSMLMATWLIGMSSRWAAGGNMKRLSHSMALIGQASFGIYLLHPAWLTFWREQIRLPQWEGMYHVYIIGGAVWCFLGAWLCREAYRWVKGGGLSRAMSLIGAMDQNKRGSSRSAEL